MAIERVLPVISPPVEYVIARGPILPPYSGKLYEYVLAGNGLWKRAMNAHLFVLVQVRRFAVPGLARLSPAAGVLTGRLPLSFLLAMLDDGRRIARRGPVEGMWQVAAMEGETLRIWRPGQMGKAGSLHYEESAPGPVVATVHSHHEMDAFFSSTDTCDEQGLGFYAVLGRIFTAPEVRVRVGVWGTFWECPAATLFEGLGPVADRGQEKSISRRYNL